MALYMLMGKYSPEALKAIFETGDDREVAARRAVEAAGGKLLSFYGMLGQDYHVVLTSEMPGPAEYVGTVATAALAGTFVSWKTIPLYSAAEMVKASAVVKKVRAAYRPPAS